MSDPVRFHLSLNVTDLDKSIRFFRTLFGIEPAKVRSDYAKFEPDFPPLVLSLEPATQVTRTGALNHLGFRMPDAKSLVAMQERLERAGLSTKREDGVECCYAKQTKFWANDPDGNLWEVYTLDGDIEHRGAGQAEEVVLGLGLPETPVTWEHRMNEPVPDAIPLPDAKASEVSLRGTFNLPLSEGLRQHIIGEAARVLKPGGRLFVHVLTGEQAVDSPSLSGPASAVRSVPFEGDPVRLLEEAGFVGVKLLKFDRKPCFVRDGVGMRETQVEGYRPLPIQLSNVEVMYKGPFRELRDDEGRIFPRGQRVAIPANRADRFLNAEFTLFEPTVDRPKMASACGS